MQNRERLEQMLKPLDVPIFQDFLTTKNVPKDYIVIRVGITHDRIYADGKILIQKPLCRVDVLTHGIADYFLADQVEKRLKELNPQRINLGYLPEISRTQVTFEFFMI